MSARFDVPPLPTQSGSYLWLYADAVVGDVTAVCIFMVGAVFSPRYAARLARHARPIDHCAVNVALYRGGRRLAWAFTEYPGVAATEPHRLAIGRSTLTYADDRLTIEVAERTAPWGTPLRAQLQLTAACGGAPEVPLDDEHLHRWEPRMARAAARLDVPTLGIGGTGLGYHDANRGEEPLGGRVPGWWWSRVHTPSASFVRYGARGRTRLFEVATGCGGAPIVSRPPAVERASHRSAWGLALPADIGAGGVAIPARHLLESSPFYARQETRTNVLHALGESADFRRFHSPLIRWMAYFRMRTERTA